MSSGPGRLEALTGLRFVAALWVVLYHFTLPWLDGVPEALHNVVGAGNLGVDVFFVLSGFVLAFAYLGPERSLRPRAFWLARLARIYPLFVFSVLLAVVAAAVAGKPPELLSIAPVLGLAQAWGRQSGAWNPPGWSLSVEALFYLLFPLIGPRLARLSRPGLVLAMVLAWLGGIMATSQADQVAHSMWQGWLFWWPPFHVHEFIVGVCAGLLYCRERGRRGAWLSVPTTIVLLLLLTQMATVTPVAHNGLLSPLVAALILGLARGGGPVAWLLSRRPLLGLGEASYALYILQAPAWFLWRDILGIAPTSDGDWGVKLQPGWVVLAFLPVLLAASILVHHVIERPARRIILSARLGRPRFRVAVSRSAESPG